MTNFEMIKNMDEVEFAEFLCKSIIPSDEDEPMYLCGADNTFMYEEDIIDWLVSERKITPKILKKMSDEDITSYLVDRDLKAEEKFYPLIDLLVNAEFDWICDEMSGSDWCEKNCGTKCAPDKNCYLRYLDYLATKS